MKWTENLIVSCLKESSFFFSNRWQKVTIPRWMNSFLVWMTSQKAVSFFVQQQLAKPKSRIRLCRLCHPPWTNSLCSPRFCFAGEETNLSPFPLESILPSNKDDFYRYPGSLTTPGCFESVVWTVFSTPIQISDKQVNCFSYPNGHLLSHTFTFYQFSWGEL